VQRHLLHARSGRGLLAKQDAGRRPGAPGLLPVPGNHRGGLAVSRFRAVSASRFPGGFDRFIAGLEGADRRYGVPLNCHGVRLVPIGKWTHSGHVGMGQYAVLRDISRNRSIRRRGAGIVAGHASQGTAATRQGRLPGRDVRSPVAGHWQHNLARSSDSLRRCLDRQARHVYRLVSLSLAVPRAMPPGPG
jgi:hypothetical protein